MHLFLQHMAPPAEVFNTRLPNALFSTADGASSRIFILPFCRSQRVLWLLEELGIEYVLKSYTRQADMRAPTELLQVHPLGKVPVITDGDKTIAETGATLNPKL